jgi:hypothetical protein
MNCWKMDMYMHEISHGQPNGTKKVWSLGNWIRLKECQCILDVY